MSIVAGFCEEVIFRGYLQKQFAAWFDSPPAGVIVSALVFGAAHGYQGVKMMLVIAVYGALLEYWRLREGSDRPRDNRTRLCQDSITWPLYFPFLQKHPDHRSDQLELFEKIISRRNTMIVLGSEIVRGVTELLRQTSFFP